MRLRQAHVAGCFWIGCLALAISCGFIMFATGRVADGVTRQGLLAVRPAMSRAELTSLIGAPLVERTREDETILEYADAGRHGFGFEIVAVLRNDSLHGLYVTQSDLGVLRCTEEKCPEILDWLGFAMLRRRWGW